jgi:hypothetical protein
MPLASRIGLIGLIMLAADGAAAYCREGSAPAYRTSVDDGGHALFEYVPVHHHQRRSHRQSLLFAMLGLFAMRSEGR